MSHMKRIVPWALCCAVLVASSSRADLVCPDSSYCTVVFNRVFGAGAQFPAGEPYDFVYIAPERGASFTNANCISESDGLPDIDVRVYLRDCSGAPIVGMPAAEIVIQSPDACFCPAGNQADAATDMEGCARLTGAPRGGGCTRVLEVWAGGVRIGELRDANGRAVKTNSPDFAHLGTSPCIVDATDLALLASQMGRSSLVPWPLSVSPKGRRPVRRKPCQWPPRRCLQVQRTVASLPQPRGAVAGVRGRREGKVRA